MAKSFKDEGLIIRKKKLLNGQRIVTIFSKTSGKLVLSAFGIKKLTSKRLSHFEVGNYIVFNYFEKGEYKTLGETELRFGHSGIKGDSNRLTIMYRMFFVLNKILPEAVPQEEVMYGTLLFLRKLNKESQTNADVDQYLKRILLLGGFIDEVTLNMPRFDIVSFIENLIGEKFQLE